MDYIVLLFRSGSESITIMRGEFTIYNYESQILNFCGIISIQFVKVTGVQEVVLGANITFISWLEEK